MSNTREELAKEWADLHTEISDDFRKISLKIHRQYKISQILQKTSQPFLETIIGHLLQDIRYVWDSKYFFGYILEALPLRITMVKNHIESLYRKTS